VTILGELKFKIFAAIETVTLQNTWMETEYRLNILLVKKDVHIEVV
jgi:hypothetical protein